MSEEIKRISRAFGEGAAFGLGSMICGLLVQTVVQQFTPKQESV